ncbi:hypothetical protein BJX99DRAFT_148783 [Aspergillus californicus]
MSASTNTTCGTATQYELPVKDAACAVPNTDTYASYFETCAAPAAVREYHDECALWAPSVDQTTQDLIDCLYDAGVDWEDVWCTGETNATATGTYPTATATATASSDDDDANSTSSAGGASETGGDDDDDTNGALARGLPGVVVWGVLALVFTAVFGGL